MNPLVWLIIFVVVFSSGTFLCMHCWMKSKANRRKDEFINELRQDLDDLKQIVDEEIMSRPKATIEMDCATISSYKPKKN